MYIRNCFEAVVLSIGSDYHTLKQKLLSEKVKIYRSTLSQMVHEHIVFMNIGSVASIDLSTFFQPKKVTNNYLEHFLTLHGWYLKGRRLKKLREVKTLSCPRQIRMVSKNLVLLAGIICKITSSFT